MSPKAFVVNIKEFLNFSKQRELEDKVESLFYKNIDKYTIPLYQREYKWESMLIDELIKDIKAHDKFLGIIILNKTKDSYEIIDGQQRITTIIIILVILFNRAGRETENKINYEQNHILSIIKKNDHFVLENDSVGEWISLFNNQIKLTIDESLDLYHQKYTYENSWNEIEYKLRNNTEDKEFLKNLLSSQLLVLICEPSGETYSSQQIFLDINEKLKMLDPEEIFKGYCFNLCYSEYHDQLKKQWVKLKSNYFKLENWGYKNFSHFIYYYLLCLCGNDDLKKDLKLNGNHFLANKSSDDIIELLNDMINYSTNLVDFKNKLELSSYHFIDICPDAEKYNTENFNILKLMCKYILENKKDQYYKFPFMMFISYLKDKKGLEGDLTFTIWKRIVTNYYVYAFAFINRVGMKDKNQIDKVIFRKLESRCDFSCILNEVKKLRNSNLNIYKLPIKIKKEHSFVLYTIMDNFDVNTNYISRIYRTDADDTDEHFIVHEDKEGMVIWKSMKEKKEFKFYLKEFINVSYLSKYRDYTINHLVIPKNLNSNILISYDIVYKIKEIKNYYQRYYEGNIPKHIKVYTDFICEMKEYQELVKLKSNSDDSNVEDKIKDSYQKFVEIYFDEVNQEKLSDLLKQTLIETFKN